MGGHIHEHDPGGDAGPIGEMRKVQGTLAKRDPHRPHLDAPVSEAGDPGPVRREHNTAPPAWENCQQITGQGIPHPGCTVAARALPGAAHSGRMQHLRKVLFVLPT